MHKYSVAKALVFHAYPVILRKHQEFLFGIFEIEKAIVHDRQPCHKDVVQLINNWLVEDKARESRIESEVELWKHVHDGLEEGVLYHHGVSSVSFSAVNKH